MTNKQYLLSEPVTSLKGVGPWLEKKLARIGIHNIQDLLLHLPYRYIDQTHLTPISELRSGYDAYIQGNIESVGIRYGRRRSLLCQVSDGSGTVTLRFFHFSKSQQAALKSNSLLRCYGQIRRGINSLEMIHPQYHFIDKNLTTTLAKQLTAVYPSTEGLQQLKLRNLIKQALVNLHNNKEALNEILPRNLVSQKLPTFLDALKYLHAPPPDANIEEMCEGKHITQKRLALEELLAHKLSLLALRKKLHQQKSPAFKETPKLVEDFLTALPFSLTRAQKKAFGEIQSDLTKTSAMYRLVQGDVGSGKTVIAALATLQAIGSNYQVAIMVPIQLLAEQHYHSFLNWFKPLNITVVLITNKLKPAARHAAQKIIATGQPMVIIGTHTLFQDSVKFAKLGLVIIDEHHRFGVQQRLALLEKGQQHYQVPHQLILTATPIPRTLAMLLYADLDHTIINELPPNRKAVSTSIISSHRRNNLITRITHICNKGNQVYWVCPLIDETEKLQCEAAISTAETLKQELPSVKVGLIHGRMKTDEKESIMQSFKQGNINLLVATTVIEVGVDISNASLMIIDNAERLGLSQLHQLRGRIGRSNIESYCVLIYQPPLAPLARKRLGIIRANLDGFAIAENDFKLRGPGDVLGTRQAGLPKIKTANFIHDVHLLQSVNKAAKEITKNYPQIITLLTKRWLGNGFDYSSV